MENQFLLARKLLDSLTRKRRLLAVSRYCDPRCLTLKMIENHDQSVPFLLEDKIKELGGVYEKTKDWMVRIHINIFGYSGLTRTV